MSSGIWAPPVVSWCCSPISLDGEPPPLVVGGDEIDLLATAWPLRDDSQTIDTGEPVIQLTLEVRHEHVLTRVKSCINRSDLPMVVGSILCFDLLRGVIEAVNPFLDLLPWNTDRPEGRVVHRMALGDLLVQLLPPGPTRTGGARLVRPARSAAVRATAPLAHRLRPDAVPAGH